VYNLVVCKDIVKGSYISHPTLDHALQNPVNSSMGVNIENDKKYLHFKCAFANILLISFQGSQNVPATGDFTGYFWLSAVYKFVKNKNRSW
jgi:hypothetical protein